MLLAPEQALTEPLNGVGPLNEDSCPHRGSSGGSHPCSSKNNHENITNPKLITSEKVKTENCMKRNNSKKNVKTG
jgi:hypothetical protein